MSLKSIIKTIPLVRDYLSFRSIYYESSSFTRFLWYRYFPYFKNNVYWPVHSHSEVRGHVMVGKGARVGHRPNCIIQGRGAVYIGNYVGIGPNTVIISGNHSLTNQHEVVKKETIIGDHSWIASNCCILAGVVLGPRTVVGAGSVVTKSFPDGFCVIAGNPARIIKHIPKEEFIPPTPEVEYYGYIRADKFNNYKRKQLSAYKFTYDISLVSDIDFE